MERQIREATLANLFTNLKSEQIKNKVKKYSHKSRHQYREFYIFQKKTKELEEKTTKIWKIIYSLVTLKPKQEDPFKEIDKGDEEEEGKVKKEEEEEEEKEIKEIEKEKAKGKVEEAPQAEPKTIVAEQQTTE